MTMDEIAYELHMMQLSDSFFPTGLYATSNGLETLFFEKKITKAHELLEFNKAIIKQQFGPSDCIVLARAYDYAGTSNHEGIIKLDSICCGLKTIKEIREASIRSGNQLVKCVKEFQDDEFLNWFDGCIKNNKLTGIYPISFAISCRSLGLSKEKTLLMFLYGFVVSNVGAALRMGMIQHYEGQQIIHLLKPYITKIAKNSLEKTESDIWQFAPHIEIFQMKHEKINSKMFIT